MAIANHSPTLQPKVIPPLQQHLLTDQRPSIHAIKRIVIEYKEEVALRMEYPVNPRIDTQAFGIRIVLYKTIEL